MCRPGRPLIGAADHQRHHELFRGAIADGGQAWKWIPITANSTTDNLRTLVPIWPGGTTALVWMHGTYKNNHGEWTTKVIATLLGPDEFAAAR